MQRAVSRIVSRQQKRAYDHLSQSGRDTRSLTGARTTSFLRSTYKRHPQDRARDVAPDEPKGLYAPAPGRFVSAPTGPKAVVKWMTRNSHLQEPLPTRREHSFHRCRMNILLMLAFIYCRVLSIKQQDFLCREVRRRSVSLCTRLKRWRTAVLPRFGGSPLAISTLNNRLGAPH